MDRTDSRSAPSPETASDDSASPANPAAPEREDLLDFEPVPLRYRTDGLTPERQRAYVEALADTGVVREAAARAGITEQAVNRTRRRADGRDFNRACEAAHMFGARRLGSIAFERAIEGTLKNRYYHGELVGQERVHDNRLLIHLIGKTGHLLQPPKGCLAICDNWEAHMEALEQGVEPPDLRPPPPARPEFTGYELVEDDEGRWWTHFPPPEGFDGEEQGKYGDYGYKRTLSPREQAVLDAELAEELDKERAAQAARRDRFFGFAGGGISPPTEAAPSETSETSGEEDRDEGPIEYKSMTPPRPAGGLRPAGRPSFPRKPESIAAAARNDSLRLHGSRISPGGRRPSTSKRPSPGILTDEPPGAVA